MPILWNFQASACLSQVCLCHQYTVCLLQNTRIVRYVVKYSMSGIVTDKDNYSHVRLGSLRYIPEKKMYGGVGRHYNWLIYGLLSKIFFFRKQIQCTQISYQICMCGGFE